MLTLNLASEIFLYPSSRPSGRLVVIEHTRDVIRCGVWMINLCPEGADKGGEIVGAGTPQQVVELPTSHTGRSLKQVLAQHPPVDD